MRVGAGAARRQGLERRTLGLPPLGNIYLTNLFVI